MTKLRPSAFVTLLARISSVFGSRYSALTRGDLPIDPSWLPIDLSQSPDSFRKLA